MLLGDKGARYGLEEFVKRDRLAGAITGDRDTDLWRAWRAARSLAANARFLESFDRLKSALAIHPLDPQKPSLVDLEINAIIAERVLTEITSPCLNCSTFITMGDTRQAPGGGP